MNEWIIAAIVNVTVSSPWHVLASLPPWEAGNGAGMGQVDKGKGQLSLNTDTGLRRCEESGNTWLPLACAVPDLYKAVILKKKRQREKQVCLYSESHKFRG